MKTLKNIILATVILAILGFGIFYFFVKTPEEQQQEEPPEQIQPSFEIPEVYGFGVFAYKGVEVNVGKVSAPSYDLPLKLEKVENIDCLLYTSPSPRDRG